MSLLGVLRGQAVLASAVLDGTLTEYGPIVNDSCRSKEFEDLHDQL